jgi:polysaccharide export outer membrane protein
LDSLQLRSGDVVQVRVWREADLSGAFVVDPRGRVVLPLLGERAVTGRSWSLVKDELLNAYAGELRNPSIELTPLRRVFVLGEVNKPGAYDLDPAMSLAGAVATAGGANPSGDLRKVRVVRDGAVVVDGVPLEGGLAGVDVRSGDQVFVGRRGWTERNSTFLVTAALSLTSIFVSLAIR